MTFWTLLLNSTKFEEKKDIVKCYLEKKNLNPNEKIPCIKVINSSHRIVLFLSPNRAYLSLFVKKNSGFLWGILPHMRHERGSLGDHL